MERKPLTTAKEESMSGTTKKVERRLRVACSALGGIYAGRIKANGCEWCAGKVDVTSDVLKAIIEHVGVGKSAEVTVDGKPSYRIAVTKIAQNAESKRSG
jgi:RIO-like serine/threonine protein kinase